MAGFTRTQNFADGDTYTAAHVMNELDNIINNLTPAMLDDESATTTAMRATTDPYPSGTASLATTLQGEIQRLRYAIYQHNSLASMQISGLHRNLVIVNNATHPDHQVDVDADEIILQSASTNTYWYEDPQYRRVASVNLTIDLAASGANGLDTGTEAATTWYFIWVIDNGTTTAGLLSTASTIGSLTFPSGYTYAALVGAIYNGASDFITISQKDNRVVIANTAYGGAGSDTDYTAVDGSAIYPSTARRIMGSLAVTGTTDGSTYYIYVASTSAGLGQVGVGGTVAANSGVIAGSFSLPIVNAPSTGLYYKVTSGSTGTIAVSGWEY